MGADGGVWEKCQYIYLTNQIAITHNKLGTKQSHTTSLRFHNNLNAIHNLQSKLEAIITELSTNRPIPTF